MAADRPPAERQRRIENHDHPVVWRSALIRYRYELSRRAEVMALHGICNGGLETLAANAEGIAGDDHRQGTGGTGEGNLAQTVAAVDRAMRDTGRSGGDAG